MKNTNVKGMWEQYTKYPYPFPVVSPKVYEIFENPLDFWGNGYIPKKILIPGCGTSLAAKLSMNFPDAEILAFDLSQTSIDFSKELCEKNNCKNVVHIASSIEQFLATNKEKYDFIYMTGVLHHQKNQIEVLSKFHSILMNDGRLFLMVYGKYVKMLLGAIQEIFILYELEPEKDYEKILKIINELKSYTNPYQNMLTRYNDYESISGLVDMFYHSEERDLNNTDHYYDVSKILDLVKGSGFEFYNWLYRSPYNYDYFKHSEKISLENRWKANEIINGCIGRHSVILSKVKIEKKIMNVDSTIYKKLKYENGIILNVPSEIMINKFKMNPVEKEIYSLIQDGISLKLILKKYLEKQNISMENLIKVLVKFYDLDLINYKNV